MVSCCKGERFTRHMKRALMQVLLRGRVHTVRGKGKSCFIVLRQARATVQVSPNPD